MCENDVNFLYSNPTEKSHVSMRYKIVPINHLQQWNTNYVKWLAGFRCTTC
jgi:hypothetical protein